MYDKTFFVQVDEAKCQECGTCEQFCGTKAVRKTDSGKRRIVDPAVCVNCGQCLVHCPFGAIGEEVSYIKELAAALKDPDRICVAMVAPAVRYALGEPFGSLPGECVEGRMWAALRRLGFEYVWDNQFTADLTILEEGSELLARVTGAMKRPLPQFTSCCPGWVKFVETFYPDLLQNLSSCKSPIGMLGALAKTYGAQKTGRDPNKIYTVSIMPCIAKKFEGLRPEMNDSGFRDIDATINTRELAYMIKQAGISFNDLPDEEPHPVLGDSTGAATIFAASGGVMEAALRFAYEEVTRAHLVNVDFHPVRGEKGIKAAAVNLAGLEVKVCVVSGLDNARKVMDEVSAGKSPYHFIEVMTCPTGCVNGGGQPLEPGTRFADAPFLRKLCIRLGIPSSPRRA
ncbi:MAG: [FeFe] hydrogenase, group A [Candidatus Omnitrophica bacterium]|nr:[FeFe] hydrogenase, group A [Candidatus Omnitrophota bacterium]